MANQAGQPAFIVGECKGFKEFSASDKISQVDRFSLGFELMKKYSNTKSSNKNYLQAAEEGPIQ